MTRQSVQIRILAMLLLAAMASAGLLIGCGEEDVPPIIDEDEIIRFVNEVGIAKELFRTSGIINGGPYSIPPDGAEFFDTLLSTRRTIEVFLVPLKVLNGLTGDSVPNDASNIYQSYGEVGLGEVREALAEVTDRMTIQVTRATPSDTATDTTEISFVRYGFFLKTQADNKPYVGWNLWGYNCVGDSAPPASIEVSGNKGADFAGNLALFDKQPKSRIGWIPPVPYIRLTEMDTVDRTERLELTAIKSGGYSPRVHLVSDYDTAGAFYRSMVRFDNVDYQDSLSFVKASDGRLYYNQITIQAISPQNALNRVVFAVPYRTP